MGKIKIKYKLIILMFVIFAIINIQNKVFASGRINVSTSSSTVNAGDTVTITITTNSCQGKVAISGSNVKISESSVYVDGTESVKVTATTSGTAQITVNTIDVVESDDPGIQVNDSASCTIKILEKTNSSGDNNNSNTNDKSNTENTTSSNNTTEEKKSNDATLKDLGIKPNDFKGFKPGTYSYSQKVPNNIESITIYATPKDSKATVTGTGKQTLKEGENEFTIKVVAEDGKASKTYTINVTREKKTEDENTTDNNTVNENTTSNENQVSDTDETSTTGLTSLEVVGQTIKFDPNVYEYRINVDGNTEKLDIKTKTSSTNIGTEVVGNDELKVGENVITILVTNEETGSTATYQIIATKSDVAASQDLQNINEEMEATTAKQKKKMYILIAVIGIIVIALIVFFITKAKNKGKSEEIEKIDLSNDEKFFNKISNQKEEEIEEVEIPDENTEIPEEMSYEAKTIRRKANFATKDTFKPIDETERIQEYEKERANLDKRDGYAQENVEDDETGVYGRKDIEQLLKERRKGGKHF